MKILQIKIYWIF